MLLFQTRADGDNLVEDGDQPFVLRHANAAVAFAAFIRDQLEVAQTR